MQSNSLSVAGQSVLITGASRGIGRALALGFAASGARVYALARPSDALQSLIKEIHQLGGEATAVACDLTGDAVKTVVDKLPSVDTLIHSAGTSVHQPVGSITHEAYHRVMQLNVEVPLFLSQLVASGWASSKKPGSIILISSQLAHVGAAERSVYCASKSALEGLCRALAIELAPQAIRVNTVCPTFTETEMTQTLLSNQEFRTSVINRIPLGRLGTPADCLGACLLLASPAGSLITGTSLRVDGGWTAQ